MLITQHPVCFKSLNSSSNNINRAFLNGNIQQVFIIQHVGFVDGDGSSLKIVVHTSNKAETHQKKT